MNMRVKDVYHTLRSGSPATLLGIGPMSEEVIRAAVRAANDYGFPVMFIASRNQVDAKELGGGYLNGGTDQFGFVEVINRVIEDEQYVGPVFVCRDHGGPWQRDEEYRGKLSYEEAMQRAKLSYRRDLEAGFNVLHIDPTKDPHHQDPLPLDTVLDRVMELIDFTEGVRRDLNLSYPISYEVGTEETAGGLTGDEVFDTFLRELLQRLSTEGLPEPDLIVGQTGTLVRMGTNVGRVDGSKARRLEAIARKYGVGLKEHNADYLAEHVLAIHPALGITSANIAPEFGHIQTEAYLQLAELEENLLGDDSVKSSGLADVLRDEVLRSGRWRKWLTKDIKDWSHADFIAHPAQLDNIVRGCGHYVFSSVGFMDARNRLFDNLSDALELPPGEVVLKAIQVSIERYASAFCLRGLNSRIGLLD